MNLIGYEFTFSRIMGRVLGACLALLAVARGFLAPGPPVAAQRELRMQRWAERGARSGEMGRREALVTSFVGWGVSASTWSFRAPGMAVAAGASEGPTAKNLGMAPDFSLETTSGSGRLRLKDLRDKWVVLYFYPADFSSGCTLEANRFQRELPRFEELNAEVVGVSVDDIDRHRDFCGKNKITFPLLSDFEGSVSFAYGTLLTTELGSFAQRQTFLVNPTGRIVYAWDSVSPQRHAEEVLGVLQELQEDPRNAR